MEPKPITLIVGDLHMGDGQTGDDFVGGKQFVQFLSKEAASPGGLDGKFELIINGDFLEFVQVYPQGYGLDPPDFWCTEEESVVKLEYMLRGHADVFTALKDFQRTGNRVTLFAGNHDVDLYWSAVQARMPAAPASTVARSVASRAEPILPSCHSGARFSSNRRAR